MNSKFKNASVLSIALIGSSNLFANEAVIVSGEKIEKSTQMATGNISVIDQSDPIKQTAHSIDETLTAQPGIYFSKTGPFGGVSSLRFRGLQNGFSKIIIDDLELSDPSSISGAFQYNQLLMTNLDSIELLRGSQNIIYGTDSIAGVIKLNSPSKDGSNLKLTYASYDTYALNASSISTREKLKLKLFVDTLKSDGISSYNEKRTQDAEKDSYNSLNTRVNMTYQLSSKSSFNYQNFFISSDSDIDNYSSDLKDEDQSSFNSMTHQVLYKSTFFKDRMSYELKLNSSNIQRNAQGSYPETNIGKSDNAALNSTYFANEYITSFFGIEYNKLRSQKNSEQEQLQEEYSVYKMTNFKAKSYLLEAGIRLNSISKQDDKLLYKIGASYNIVKNHYIKSNYATGYKSATLYQITNKSNVNTKLEATESKSYEIGYIFDMNTFKFESTYFHINLENQIDWDGEGYYNIGRTKSRGLETSATFKNSLFNSTSSATITRATNDLTKEYLSKTPRLMLKQSFLFKISDFSSWTLNYQYIGERNDSGRLPSYSLIDTSYKFKGLILTINNILDTEYETVRNYGSFGRNFKISYSISI